MTTQIRQFDASTDADRVSEFLNSNAFGPIVAGLPLDGDSLLAAIRECGMRLLLVAENRGAIVGTLGYARMSGRRVAPDGHLFAVMFVVERSLRGGFLVSELFAESFQRFAEIGLHTLRLEVDPANRRAFPLYVRVGFRNASFPHPDEDGYLELVNHLPGLASALPLGQSGAASPSMPGSETRSLRSARKMSLTSGVHNDADNRRRIDYDVHFGASRVKATVDAQTGRIVSATINGCPTGIRDEEETPPQGEQRSPLRHDLDGFEAEMDVDSGTLTVRHPDRLGPLLVDAFPACGDTPAGVRRPARTPTAVTVRNTDHGTIWASTSGHLTRVVTFGRRHIDVHVTQTCGHTVTAFPWSGFRDAELRVHFAGRDERSGHVVRGIWPPEATDFEPAVGPLFTSNALGTRASWRELSSGVGVDVVGRSDGTWRVEGPHLARINAENGVAYRLDLTRKTPAAETPTAAGFASRPQRSIGSRTGNSGVTLSAQAGLQSWRHRGIQVLDSAPQRNRTIGPLPHVPAALWVASLNNRSDLDHGVEWALHDTRFVLDGTDTDPRSWSILPNLDCSSIDVALKDTTGTPNGRELAVCLFVPASAKHVDIGTGSGLPQRIQIGSHPWRTWTRTFQFPTPAGDLLVTPTAGRHPEVLLRSGPSGTLATMLVRSDEPTHASWRLSLT